MTIHLLKNINSVSSMLRTELTIASPNFAILYPELADPEPWVPVRSSIRCSSSPSSTTLYNSVSRIPVR